MDFGMAVAKGQAGCEVVVKTREILTEGVQRRSQGREPIHVGQIISPVNNVFPFVQEEKRFRGSRCAVSANVREFEIHLVASDASTDAAIGANETTEKEIHRDRPHPRFGFAINHDEGMIRGTFINCGTSVVRIKRALGDISINVPVCQVVRAIVQVLLGPCVLVQRITGPRAVITGIDDSINVIVSVHHPAQG